MISMRTISKRPIYRIPDTRDPAIETDVRLNPEKTYSLSVGDNLKIHELSAYLDRVLSAHYSVKPGQIENIAIMPCRFSGKEDYVLVNPDLRNQQNGFHDIERRIYNWVSSSEYVHELVEQILTQQPDLFVNVFQNSEYLNLDKTHKGVKILAPEAKIAMHFDDKIIQREEVAKKLDLPVPLSFMASGVDDLIDLYLEEFKGDAFITCSHGSAGSGSLPVHSLEEILNSPKIKPDDEFIISELLHLKSSPSTYTIVAGEDDIYVAGISDQIMNGVHYLGNISPSVANRLQKDKMLSITKKIGELMCDKGYRGPFGIDFMIDQEGKVYFTEINPRYTAPTHQLTEAHIGVNPYAPSIPEMVFNAICTDNLGFDPQSCTLPEVPWGLTAIKGKKGQITKNIIKDNPPYIRILGYPGNDVLLDQDTSVARIIYNGNPHATREEILQALSERAKDIVLSSSPQL